MTADTKALNPSPDKELRQFHRREVDPNQIRAWPVIENGEERELLIRKDAIAWLIAGKGELTGKTIVGLRTAGAKAIPVSAPYAEVKDWWIGARHHTMSAKTEAKTR